MSDGAPATGAAAPLPEIDAATARAWMDAREAVLLDVREANEFEYENVPGSVLLPLSFLDPDVFPPITDRKVIVLCAIGKRAAAAQKQLADSGLPNIYNLTGGLDAWKKAGFETQGGKYEALDYSI
ncbi:MAG: rhodanese-like domain-containing protein [Hyphomicrobiales bacterium]|nr:rhodanese-like domain-containing protein [Hyphomicrobiales bacterium]MCP5372667.1 rhodanese-like domain-containing protein [Hyphomicrobiales bacterium]